MADFNITLVGNVDISCDEGCVTETLTKLLKVNGVDLKITVSELLPEFVLGDLEGFPRCIPVPIFEKGL